MRQLRLRSKIKTLPVHQLSNFLLGNFSAIMGGVCLDQTGLESLLSNVFSLIIKTLNMILRLHPLLQSCNGRHDWKDYDSMSERGWSIPSSEVSEIPHSGDLLGIYLGLAHSPTAPVAVLMHGI